LDAAKPLKSLAVSNLSNLSNLSAHVGAIARACMRDDECKNRVRSRSRGSGAASEFSGNPVLRLDRLDRLDMSKGINRIEVSNLSVLHTGRLDRLDRGK
jgi:hypothetical protein